VTPDLVVALGPVLDLLRRLGVRHFVSGSIASSAHGVPRASIDADVVAELRPDHTAPVLAGLRDAYYMPEGRVTDAIARRGSFNVIHLETMMKVDVFVSRGRPFDLRALERARPAADASFDKIPVSSAEDTILAKLEWFRRGGETSERQWTDLRGLVGAGAPLDLAYLRAGADELLVSDLLTRLLEQANGATSELSQR
jgi:hypothetical protein